MGTSVLGETLRVRTSRHSLAVWIGLLISLTTGASIGISLTGGPTELPQQLVGATVPVPSSAAASLPAEPPLPPTAAPVASVTTTSPPQATSVPRAAAKTPNPPARKPSASSGATYGWQLTADNTGLTGAKVDRNALPPYRGPISPGMTLSMVKIATGVDLTNVPNVTLDRVWIQPADASRALILGPGTLIKDSDIDGSAMPTGERWGLFHGDTGGAGYRIERVRVTGVSIGAWLDGSAPATMSDTYIHNLISTGGAHLDGFTRRSGTGPLTITRSRIAVDYSDAGGSYATGAVFLQNTWGGQIGGITLRDSLLEGNGFTMALEDKGAGTSFGAYNVRLRPTEYDAVSKTGSVGITEWTSVHLYDTGKPNAAGAAVAQP